MIWQIVQTLFTLAIMINQMLEFCGEKTKKSNFLQRASSIASSLQFFSNRIHRLTDQELFQLKLFILTSLIVIRTVKGPAG